MLHVTGVRGMLRFSVLLASSMLLAAGAFAQSPPPQAAPLLPPSSASGQVLPSGQAPSYGQAPASGQALNPGQVLAPGQALPPANPAQPIPPPPEPPNPGLIEEFGKLLKNSASGLSSTWQGTWKGSQQTIDAIGSGAQGAVSGAAKGATDAAKGATDALISTTSQTMRKGRVACPVAGNGAPDCRAAAEQLCKTSGYKSGSSLDIETAETCNAKVYLSGRTGAPGECKTQNFVTRAMCQ